MSTQTTFYLVDTAADVGSSTLPSDYLGAWNVKASGKAGANARATSSTNTSTTTTSSVSSGAGTKQGCAQFCSPLLAAQTIGAGNWTGGWSVKQTSGIMSHQGACAIYLVNGSTGAIRTTIFALANVGASRVSSTGKTAYSASLSGSSATVTAGDYLVFEIGTNKIGASSDVGSALYGNSTTISSDNAANTSPKSFFTAPAAITLSDPTQNINATGVASDGAVGTPSQVQNDLILATGVATASAIGSATVTTNADIVVGSGVASSEAVGTPISILNDLAINATGYDASVAIPTPTSVTSEAFIVASGVASAGAIGTPSQVQNDLILATGYDASVTPGTPTVSATSPIVVGGNDFSGGIGSPTVSPGTVNINATGVASAGAVGTPVLVEVTIAALGVPSSEAIGLAVLLGGDHPGEALRSRINLRN